jgi:8-oxo-dGTP pyrophosphatase MutT (NUDIX family)
MRLAYRLLKLYWGIFGGSARGVTIVIRHAGPEGPEILLVQPSYRPRLELPGGGCKRGELPQAAAARELYEELGLRVEPDELAVLQEHQFVSNNRQVEETIFLIDFERPPALFPDGVEIIEAGFHRLDAIKAGRVNISLKRALVNLK